MNVRNRTLGMSLGCLLTIAGCSAGTSSESIVDLGDVGSKADFNAIEGLPVSLGASQSMNFSIKADASFLVQLRPAAAKGFSIKISESDEQVWTVAGTTRLEKRVGVPAGEPRKYLIQVTNTSTEAAEATLSILNAPAPDAVGSVNIPALTDAVVSQNEYCEYSDSIPYVRNVKWDHPRIQAAMRALNPGWRSIFSYREWQVPYALENESPTNGTDDQKREARVRNYVRVLLGEHRDYPDMLEAKLDVILNAQNYAAGEEVQSYDLEKNLFAQLSYPAYKRLTSVMRAMHGYRQQNATGGRDGYNYANPSGYGSNRVDSSIPPFTHCEMEFMFSRFLVAGAPTVSSYGGYDDYENTNTGADAGVPAEGADGSVPAEGADAGVAAADDGTWPKAGATSVSPAQYEQMYERYRDGQCDSEDLSWMYNFRGHKNFQPLWLDSNAFIWNSRRARSAEQYRTNNSYYMHPFADRFERSRQAWGSYLFYRDEDAAAMQRAGDQGGGPIMYITDQDSDGNGIADYKLFSDRNGCGDQGVSGTNPDSNCNMVPWDVAAAAPIVTGAASAWNPDNYGSQDMGFMRSFMDFNTRMARFTQALDRHTNWGPTGYYMVDASSPTAMPNQVKFQGAYSPVVACSYDISASDSFASGSYSSTDPFEVGHTKWMYVMRFRAENYYDEQNLREGRPMDFVRNYFNETSLSNDHYSERALDRFGMVPPEDIYANIYFVYGSRKEAVPTYPDVPPPSTN